MEASSNKRQREEDGNSDSEPEHVEETEELRAAKKVAFALSLTDQRDLLRALEEFEKKSTRLAYFADEQEGLDSSGWAAVTDRSEDWDKLVESGDLCVQIHHVTGLYECHGVRCHWEPKYRGTDECDQTQATRFFGIPCEEMEAVLFTEPGDDDWEHGDYDDPKTAKATAEWFLYYKKVELMEGLKVIRVKLGGLVAHGVIQKGEDGKWYMKRPRQKAEGHFVVEPVEADQVFLKKHNE